VGTVQTRVAIALPIGWSQVLPADPYRYAVTLFNSNTQAMSYAFGDATPTAPLFLVPVAYAPISVTEEDLGELITRPFWAQAGAVISSFNVVAMAYNPERRRVYEQWLNRQLSQLGASGLITQGSTGSP
jgi:hypothetical protein